MRRLDRWLVSKQLLHFVLIFGFILLFQYLMPVILGSNLLFSILVVALLIMGIVLAIMAYRRGVEGGSR